MERFLVFVPGYADSAVADRTLDRLGVPSAVWTSQKTWLDHTGHHIKTRGPDDVSCCPYQIGIVSTGLIFRRTPERARLLKEAFGTLVLDEAHRARRGAGTGANADEPNNLLSFMYEAARNSRHVILGTATPIQTDVKELWDLLEILGKAPSTSWAKATLAGESLT